MRSDCKIFFRSLRQIWRSYSLIDLLRSNWESVDKLKGIWVTHVCNFVFIAYFLSLRFSTFVLSEPFKSQRMCYSQRQTHLALIKMSIVLLASVKGHWTATKQIHTQLQVSAIAYWSAMFWSGMYLDTSNLLHLITKYHLFDLISLSFCFLLLGGCTAPETTSTCTCLYRSCWGPLVYLWKMWCCTLVLRCSKWRESLWMISNPSQKPLLPTKPSL